MWELLTSKRPVVWSFHRRCHSRRTGCTYCGLTVPVAICLAIESRFSRPYLPSNMVLSNFGAGTVVDRVLWSDGVVRRR